MKWFRDLAMMSKLSLAFGLVAVLFMTVSVVGLSTGAAANAAMETMYQRDARGLEAALRANADVVRIARAYRQGMLLPDAASKDETLREIADLDAQVTRELDELDATLVLDASRQHVAEARVQVHEYAALGAECVRLSATDPARTLETFGVASPLGKKVRAHIEAVIETKHGLMAQTHEASAARYSRDRALALCGLVVAIAIALASVLLIARAVSAPLGAALRVLDRVAAGDLTARLVVNSRDEVGRMGSSLNTTVDTIRAALIEVRQVAGEVATASEQLAGTAAEISRGAQTQAASLEATAASLEEITATVKQNAESAQQAAQLASASRDSAEIGGRVVEATAVAMGEIAAASKRIAAISATIDEIAFQTNLLALNAAVEAARAGEQGRGFAVVSTEVRGLAKRSGSAAREIRGLIGDSSAKVEAGSQHVTDSGRTLHEIVASVRRVTDMVGEIAAASREQTAGVEQVNLAITQMDHVTQANASQTEELTATAERLASESQTLRGLVAQFRLDDRGETAAATRRGAQRSEMHRAHARPDLRLAARPAAAARRSAKTA